MSYSQEEVLGRGLCGSSEAESELPIALLWFGLGPSDSKVRVVPCAHTVAAAWITREAVACRWHRAAFGVEDLG